MTSPARKVSLFRNGRSQALRIPKEFELPGTEATIVKDGNRLIIEPVQKKTLCRNFSTAGSRLDEDVPEIEIFRPNPWTSR